MTKTILSAALIMAAMTAKGQETVFSQDFEDFDTVEEQQWGAIDGDADGAIFGFVTTQPVLVQLGFTGNVMGSTNFYLDDENNPVEVENSDNMLLSPVLELPEEDNLSLSMRISGIGMIEEASAGYEIYVLDTNNIGDIGTIEEMWAVLDAATPLKEDVMNGPSEVQTYDISGHAGQEVIVLVRHNNCDGPTYLFVDEITITSGVLSNPELAASAFRIYPNPVEDVLHLQGNDGLSIQEVKVTDVNGRIVKTIAIDGGQNTSVVMDGLASGSYFVSIATDKGTAVKQVIKK